MTFRNSAMRDLYAHPDDFILGLAERMDDPRQVTIDFNEGTAVIGSGAWAPGQKVEIIEIRLVNGNVAIAASTNTTAFDIDVYNAVGDTKEADLAAKAANVAVAVRAALVLALSATPADRIIEADESLQVVRTIAGTQGENSLVISYKYVD